jgi:hypothetical protein
VPPNSRCMERIRTQVQDVRSCQYYSLDGDVPPKGTVIRVAIRKHPLAETENGVAVGFLPPEFDYILDCAGYEYTGVVVLSRRGPQPVVLIDLEAHLKQP